MVKHNETLNKRDLAKACKKANSKYTISEYVSIFNTLEDVLENILLVENKSVKFGKLFKFSVIDKDERKAWDGIHQRFYHLPQHFKVVLTPLKRLKDINKLLLDSKK